MFSVVVMDAWAAEQLLDLFGMGFKLGCLDGLLPEALWFASSASKPNVPFDAMVTRLDDF